MKTSPTIAAIRFVTVITVFLVASGACRGQNLSPEAFAPSYRNLRDAVYQNLPILAIRDSYNRADSLRKLVIEDTSDNAYWSARIEYLAGRAEAELRNWKEADSHLSIGLKAITYYLERRSCDEGFRVKSAITGQLCLIKIRQMEFWWVLRHGLEVSYFANVALKLQPNNGKARILIGSTLVYPPLIYGGNPKRGIEVMNDALLMPDIEKDDLFNIFSGIGIAYGRLDKRDEALAYLNRALQLYPGNRYAGQKFKDIAAGRHVDP